MPAHQIDLLCKSKPLVARQHDDKYTISCVALTPRSLATPGNITVIQVDRELRALITLMFSGKKTDGHRPGTHWTHCHTMSSLIQANSRPRQSLIELQMTD